MPRKPTTRRSQDDNVWNFLDHAHPTTPHLYATCACNDTAPFDGAPKRVGPDWIEHAKTAHKGKIPGTALWPYRRRPAPIYPGKPLPLEELDARTTYTWTEISQAGSVAQERTGQYWCAGPGRSVYVVPTDGLDGPDGVLRLLRSDDGEHWYPSR